MVRKGTPEALLRKVRLDPGLRKVRKSTPGSRVLEKVPLEHCCARSAWIQGLRKRSEKVPLQHCCARSAWIQGLRKGPTRPGALLRKVCLDALLRKVRLDPGSPKKVRKGTPGALLRKVRLDPGSPKRSEKVPLEHCCARSAWIQGLRKGPKRYSWSIVAQGPLGSRFSHKVRLDPGSEKRSEKVPLEHCCARSA